MKWCLASTDIGPMTFCISDGTGYLCSCAFLRDSVKATRSVSGGSTQVCGALHFTEPRVVLAADYELINLSIMVSVQSSCNKRFICDDQERTSAGWDGEFVIHYCFSIIIPSSRPSTLTLEPKAGWL